MAKWCSLASGTDSSPGPGEFAYVVLPHVRNASLRKRSAPAALTHSPDQTPFSEQLVSQCSCCKCRCATSYESWAMARAAAIRRPHIKGQRTLLTVFPSSSSIGMAGPLVLAGCPALGLIGRRRRRSAQARRRVCARWRLTVKAEALLHLDLVEPAHPAACCNTFRHA